VCFFNSFFNSFFAAEHEAKPLIAGRKLVLTYTLEHKTLNSTELVLRIMSGMTNMRALLSLWKTNMRDQTLAPITGAFLLDQHYTDTDLCYDGLKGHDQYVAAHLREVCAEYGFCLYFANLYKKVTELNDSTKWDESADTGIISNLVYLKKMVHLDGSLVEEYLTFDETTIVQENALENSGPDKKIPELEDFLNFEKSTHEYNKTVRT